MSKTKSTGTLCIPSYEDISTIYGDILSGNMICKIVEDAEKFSGCIEAQQSLRSALELLDQEPCFEMESAANNYACKCEKAGFIAGYRASLIANLILPRDDEKPSFNEVSRIGMEVHQ